MATFQGGEFVVMVKCLKKNRRGVLSEAYEVVGSQQLQQALAGMVPQLLAAATGTSAAPSESPPAHGVLTDSELLQIPLGAEERAEQLRKMLQEAWRHHVDGTRFEGRRQMYRAVNVDGAPPFEWWDDVAQVPFTNTAVADPVVSQRVYEYLGPLVLAHRGNGPENQAVDIDVADGDAGDLDNHETQNPEPNSRPLEDVLPIPEGSVTLQMLVNQTHPEEPFRTFIPGQISELKRCLERFEGDRLASYAAMRVPVSETYQTWYSTGGGHALWSRICQEFPDHMHMEPSPLESLKRSPPKKRARKRVTEAAMDLRAKKRRTNRRHAQAVQAKNARDSDMGLLRM